MFKNFKSSFSVFSNVENVFIEFKDAPLNFSELLSELGGKTFDQGLYSIHTYKDSLKWTRLISNYFEKFRGEIISFAHDWMGRQFCASTNSNEGIYLFDPATLENFYLAENLLEFHNTTLPNSKIINLASDFFDNALRYLEITKLGYEQCLGFKIPLFLNGNEDVSNYEIADLEVYWEYEFQLYNQVKDLPDGTKLTNVTINPFQGRKLE